MEDVFENLLLRDAEHRIVVIRMWTYMDDSVHVQVEIVEIRDLEKKHMHRLRESWRFIRHHLPIMQSGNERMHTW